jgi:GT2 family glycosyltransferase
MSTKYSQEQVDFLKGKRLMVATPCYGGQTTALYTQSMLKLQSECARYKIEMVLLAITNESLITRARNDLVYHFLKHKDARGVFEYIMFIDADIQFEADHVIRLIVHNKDIVTGAYPMKLINYNNIENKALPVTTLVKLTTEYAINPKFTEEEAERARNSDQPERITLQVKNGLIEVLDAGTGFMLIKRDVLEQMITAFPEIKYVRDMTSLNADGSIDRTTDTQYALFDGSIDEESRRYLSEDYTFCRRWQKIGGRIWTDPEIVLNHVGTHVFRGRNLIE